MGRKSTRVDQVCIEQPSFWAFLIIVLQRKTLLYPHFPIIEFLTIIWRLLHRCSVSCCRTSLREAHFETSSDGASQKILKHSGSTLQKLILLLVILQFWWCRFQRLLKSITQKYPACVWVSPGTCRMSPVLLFSMSFQETCSSWIMNRCYGFHSQMLTV